MLMDVKVVLCARDCVRECEIVMVRVRNQLFSGRSLPCTLQQPWLKSEPTVSISTRRKQLSFKHFKISLILMLPYLDRSVFGSRRNTSAIWRPIQCIDFIGVARQCGFSSFAGWDFPELGGAILACTHQETTVG